MLHHLLIISQITAERISNVTAPQAVIGSELRHQVSLVLRLGKLIHQGRKVATAQSEDVGCCLHQIHRDLATAVSGKIKPPLLRQSDAMTAGGLARKRAGSSACHHEIRAPFRQFTKNRLRQRTPARVSSADEKDVFQDLQSAAAGRFVKSLEGRRLMKPSLSPALAQGFGGSGLTMSRSTLASARN